MKLTKDFFQRPTEIVAKELLGNILYTNINGKLTGGIIIDVECYYGYDDPANHGYRGKTERNEVIFREGGYVYIYINYGIHHLLNISTEKEGYPSSVFIRALKPITGIDIMMKRRGINDLKNLTNGPAKLTKALGIDISLNRVPIDSEKIFIQKGESINNYHIIKTKRIGISKGQNLLRRFFIKTGL